MNAFHLKTIFEIRQRRLHVLDGTAAAELEAESTLCSVFNNEYILVLLERMLQSVIFHLIYIVISTFLPFTIKSLRPITLTSINFNATLTCMLSLLLLRKSRRQ